MRSTHLLISVVVLACLLAVPCPLNAVVAGDDVSTVEASAAIRKKKKKKYISHVVNVGETLYSILTRYHIPLSALREDNPQLITRDITQGEILQIDLAKVGSVTDEQIKQEMQVEIERLNAINTKLAAPPVKKEETEVETEIKREKEAETKVSEPQKLITEEYTPEMAGPQPVVPENDGYIRHMVQDGETLFSLGRVYNVSVPEIRAANPEVLAGGLKAGSVIKIPLTPEQMVAMGLIPEKETAEYPEEPGIADQNKYDSIAVNARGTRYFNNPALSLNLSMLLPLTQEGKQVPQFVEFYQGVIIALDSLKGEGLSVNANIYDTKRDRQKIAELIQSGALAKSDIIIGPVYEELFCEVAAYAKSQQIPIVSPLATVNCGNPFIFQMAPDEKFRYEKVKEYLADKKVIFFTSEADDSAFVAQIKAIAPQDYISVPFDIKAKPETIGPVLDQSRENVFVVAASTEQATDALLSKLTTIKGTYYNRGVSVLGSPRFARMTSLDPAYFFKLDVKYITSYHVDRTNPQVLEFDSTYITRFHKVPSLYAYRGYDVTMFFLGSMKEFGSRFYDYIDDYFTTILQVRYRFRKEDTGFRNVEWMLVNYTPSYNILVK